MENQTVKDGKGNQVNWDFSLTTTEQLLRLEELLSSGDESGAEIYSRQLIAEGYLSQSK